MKTTSTLKPHLNRDSVRAFSENKVRPYLRSQGSSEPRSFGVRQHSATSPTLVLATLPQNLDPKVDFSQAPLKPPLKPILKHPEKP